MVAGIAAAAAMGVFGGAAVADVGVVASIKPVHSLVALVMDGVDEPGLIVGGAGSPHTYALTPSEASTLETAKVVFWIGPELEAFLEKPVRTLASDARAMALADLPGLIKLATREGGSFEAHMHGDEDDGEHEEHEQEEHEDEHGAFDAHLWLDPVNAGVMVEAIRDTLVEADPAHAGAYVSNAEATLARLNALKEEIEETLSPVRGGAFLVFHDAYHSFEHRFGIEAAGSITVSPEVIPGVRRVAEIRDMLRRLGAVCVFTEPQFTPRLVDVVTEGTAAKSGVLDPLGAEFAPGPDLYFTLMRNLAGSMRACLQGG